MGLAVMIIVASTLAGCSSRTAGTTEVTGTPVPDAAVPAMSVEKLPRVHDGATSIARAIHDAYGSLLVTVSVEPTLVTGFVDPDYAEQDGFRVAYQLVDCPVQAANYVAGLNGTGLVPPITQLSDEPPFGQDRMDPLRFRELLRAYARVTSQSFGALQSCRSAQEWGGDVVTIQGREYPIGDLWVVTPGARSQTEFRRLYSQTWVPCYVFSFPSTGAPALLNSASGMGEHNHFETQQTRPGG